MSRDFVVGKNNQLLTDPKHLKIGDYVYILHPCYYRAEVLEVLETGFVIQRLKQHCEPFQVKKAFLRGKIEYIMRNGGAK